MTNPSSRSGNGIISTQLLDIDVHSQNAVHDLHVYMELP